MKKQISQWTINELNKISPDVLVARGVIRLVEGKANEFICPFCDNGAGSDATGIKPKIYSDHVGWYCQRCGEKFDNLKILANYFGLSSQYDFQALVEKSCDFFGIRLEIENDGSANETKHARPAQKKEKHAAPMDDAKLNLIRADLQTDSAALIEFVNQHGGKWRGLPADLLIKFGCRYVANWTHPNSRAADNKYSTPTPRILIPAGEHYFARLTCSLDDFDEKTRQYVREKEHAGNTQLFNSDALTAPYVFALEGEVDAMTAELVGYRAVATGGAGSYSLLVDAVKELPTKPRIIILFDPDETGRKFAPILQAALLKVGCASVIRFLSDDNSKIDCNQILVDDGEDTLRDKLKSIFDSADAELQALEEQISLMPLPFDDTDRAFYFSGDCETLTNARRLEKFCSDRVKFVADIDSWLTWQKSGVWRRCGSDKNHHVLPFVFELADRLTLSLPPVEDGLNKRKAAMNITKQFKDFKKFSPCISSFKGLSSIRITAADLDAYPNLLCVQNGVVDLETGALMNADPKLLLTQQCAVAYDPTAQSPLVDNFFRDIMPNNETRAGLLRWLGYNLTGDVSEERFMIWLGESGANGKGSLSRTLAELLCGYAATLPQDALVVHKFDTANGHTASLNPLIGARFAISEELAQNSFVNSALIKTLVGGDMLTFRALRQEAQTHKPTAKINMASNFSPKFQNIDDGGLERRALVMPYTQTFKGDKADPHLKKKLLLPENLRALLALLVGEAVAWYKDGLIFSEEMTTATRDSLAENDWLVFFFEDYCELGTGELPRKKLLDEIHSKCPMSQRFSDREIVKMIQRRGVGYRKSRKGFIFTGIRLCSDTDRDFGGEPLEPDDIPPGI